MSTSSTDDFKNVVTAVSHIRDQISFCHFISQLFDLSSYNFPRRILSLPVQIDFMLVQLLVRVEKLENFHLLIIRLLSKLMAEFPRQTIVKLYLSMILGMESFCGEALVAFYFVRGLLNVSEFIFSGPAKSQKNVIVFPGALGELSDELLCEEARQEMPAPLRRISIPISGELTIVLTAVFGFQTQIIFIFQVLKL